jgi:hypothetical protein
LRRQELGIHVEQLEVGGDEVDCGLLRLEHLHEPRPQLGNAPTHPAKVASQHTAALFRRGRPLLLGAWAGVWKLPDWKFLPMSDYYSQTEQNEKK